MIKGKYGHRLSEDSITSCGVRGGVLTAWAAMVSVTRKMAG